MNVLYKGRFKVTQRFKGPEIHDGYDLVGLDSKDIYSTVDGVVERAGWENANDKKQGFGQYVRIKENGSVDRHYYGHLSSINVTVGQSVRKGDKIGVEGSTGKSTGSHLHYCIRPNATKANAINPESFTGVPNKEGTYKSVQPTPPTAPTNVSANTIGNDVHLTYTGAKGGINNDITNYHIYRNGVGINTGSTNTSYIDKGLPNGTYKYEIYAIGQGVNSLPAIVNVTVKYNEKADINKDGKVNVSDIVTLKSKIIKGEKADVNGDGKTNIADILAVKKEIIK